MSLRPSTLKEIAERSDSLGDFGRHLRDWLHELRRASSRTQAAEKRRNIFTPPVDLPLALRAGRPAKSAEEKRQTNAERQRRFREARRNELTALRRLARKKSARRNG